MPEGSTAGDPPYQSLTPDVVMDALASVGLMGDGRQMALSSYENRVYQAHLEDGSAVVAKFYRPKRWSEAQILEEHAFSQELVVAEVPVIAPMVLNGQTLARCWSGLAAFWHASTASVHAKPLNIVRHWIWPALARPRVTGCWVMTWCRSMCRAPGTRRHRMHLI